MYYVADMIHTYKVAQSSCIFLVLMTVTTSGAARAAMAQLQTRLTDQKYISKSSC